MSWWGSSEPAVAQTELQSLISTNAEERHVPEAATKALVRSQLLCFKLLLSPAIVQGSNVCPRFLVWDVQI